MSNVSIMAHGSRLTAHGSRLTAHGSRVISYFSYLATFPVLNVLLFPVKVLYHVIRHPYNTIIANNVQRLRRIKYLRQEQSGSSHGKFSFSQVSHYYFGNAGDTVLSKCVRLCFSKFFDVKGWNMIYPHERFTRRTTDGINHTNMLIIGGGGMFMRASKAVEASAKGYRTSGWQWALTKERLARINVPVAVFSCGYNFFRGTQGTELFRESMAELARRSVFFGLRNHGSVRALQNILPEELRSKITYQPCTTTIIRQLYGENLPEHREKSGKCVALNMADDMSYERFGDNKQLILEQAAKAAKRIEQKGYRIFYVCHSDADLFMLPYLRAENVCFEVRNFTRELPYSIIDFYDSMDIVIGMRGHTQLIPFGVNTEILTLGSHDKMLWFLEDIDASDWYVEMSDDPANLCDKILDRFEYIHVKNPGETHERLISQQKKLWDITQSNMEFLRGILS